MVRISRILSPRSEMISLRYDEGAFGNSEELRRLV
jgi:hypothetical protein